MYCVTIPNMEITCAVRTPSCMQVKKASSNQTYYSGILYKGNSPLTSSIYIPVLQDILCNCNNKWSKYICSFWSPSNQSSWRKGIDSTALTVPLFVSLLFFVQLLFEGGINLFLFGKSTVSAMGQHSVTPFSKVHQFRDDRWLHKRKPSVAHKYS